jgi:hypothetical protein
VSKASFLHLIIRLILGHARDILNGLRSVGFKVFDGINGTGSSLLARTKGGGYYLGKNSFQIVPSGSTVLRFNIDTGTCQLIVDRKIKLKNDSHIAKITENGLEFENGSELPADVIVFATG